MKKTAKGRFPDAIMDAADNIIRAWFDLAVRTLNESSGQDTASVTTDSDREEDIGVYSISWKHIG